MAGSPLLIHVIGLKNTGKSGLVEGLVQELIELGFKTAVLKHDGSGHFHWDREGTDTHRMRIAGSPVTAILSDREFAIHATEGLAITLQEIVDLFFRGFDILLVEGLKKMKGRKIEVLRKGASTHPLSTDEDLVATFGDRLFDRNAPHYDPSKVGELAGLVSRILQEYKPGTP